MCPYEVQAAGNLTIEEEKKAEMIMEAKAGRFYESKIHKTSMC